MEFSSDDVEFALAQAESLLGIAHPAQLDMSYQCEGSHGQLQAGGELLAADLPPAPDMADQAVSPWQPHQHSTLQLNEQLMEQRIRLHERELQVLELQAANQSLLQDLHTAQSTAERHASEAALAEEATEAKQAVVDRLTEQLEAFGGITPEEVAALQQQAKALAREKAALEQHAAELSRALEQQLQRLADGIDCWRRTQAELQQENQRLAGQLQRRAAAQAELQQEKRLLAAKVAMLDARPPLQPSSNALPAAALAEHSWPAGFSAAAALTAAKENEGELLARCRKYKQAVRVLKERLAEREQQHAAALERADTALREQQQHTAELGARLRAAEEQAQQQEGQRVEVGTQVQELQQAFETERHRANSERQRLQEAATQAESQAKSAALQVLHLEKQLATLRARQNSGNAAGAPSMQQQEVEQLRTALASKEAMLKQLQEQLARQEASALEGERRLRLVEGVMRRLASKQPQQ